MKKIVKNSLGTHLVLEQLHLNNKELFKHIASAIKLREAWYQIKNNSNMLKEKLYSETTNDVDFLWFENISRSLMNGTFNYSTTKKINILKSGRESNFRSLNVVNFKIKIIEKSFLNCLETIFEGVYIWISISKKEFKKAKEILKTDEFKDEFKITLDEKTNKHVYKKKCHIVKKIFKPTSFGFRTGLSAHHAFQRVKTVWLNNTAYFIDFSIMFAFENVNRNKLKNIFNKYVVDHRIWEEIEKMLNVGYIQKDITQMQVLKTTQTSIFSFFLLNVYMHDFDQFMENLDKKNALLKNEKYKDKNTNKAIKKNMTDKRVQYVRYADEILLGLIGSKNFLICVQKSINNFIKNHLHLTLNKCEIIFKNQSFAMFLGHQIRSVNLFKKTMNSSKYLNVVQKFKSKVIQKLKLENSRISRIKRNKFKNEVLEFVSVMSNKFNLNPKKRKESNVLVSLFAYKFLGEILAKTLNFSSLLELVKFLVLLNKTRELKKSSLQKFNLVVNKKMILSKINGQIYDFRHSGSNAIEKIESILNEVQNIVQVKTKSLSDSIIAKSIKNKAERVPRSKISFKKQSVKFITIRANIMRLCHKLRSAGFLHLCKNQASSCFKVLSMSEAAIVEYYDSVMREILIWFSGVDNFSKIKGIIESVMRRSCLFTLKRKFKLKSIAEATHIYTKNVVVTINDKHKVKLISKEEVIG